VSCKWDRVSGICAEVHTTEVASTAGSRKGSLIIGSEEESSDKSG